MNEHTDDELDGDDEKPRLKYRSATEEDLANVPDVIFVFGRRPQAPPEPREEKPPEKKTDDG